MNLSLGTSLRDVEGGAPLPHADVCAYAEQRGVVLVAASGNDGTLVPFLPAALPTVLAVGSVDRDGRVSSFTSSGPHVVLHAPGESIVGLGLSGYRRSSGTSHAAPFASAAAALVIAAGLRGGERPSPEQVRAILLSTARPRAPGGPRRRKPRRRGACRVQPRGPDPAPQQRPNHQEDAMDPLTPEGRTRLARHLLTLAFASVPEERRPPLVAASNSVGARLERPVDRADAGHLLRLTNMEDLSGANRLQRRALLRVFGLPRVQRARDDLPDGERRESLARTPTAVLLAAVRITLDPKDATQHDITTLTRWVRKEGRPGLAMDEYVAEARGLPPGFDTDSS